MIITFTRHKLYLNVKTNLFILGSDGRSKSGSAALIYIKGKKTK